MRQIKFLRAIVVLLSLVLVSSCSKDGDASVYDKTVWSGTYHVNVEGSETEECDDYTACISLEFHHDASECALYTGLVGDMYAANRRMYEVRWYSKSTFALCETSGGQTIQYYSGTIDGDRMSFDFLSCDKVERTIELVKVIR